MSIEVAPDLPYLKVINKVRTGSPESDPELQFTSDIAEADGSHTVVLEGSVPAGRQRGAGSLQSERSGAAMPPRVFAKRCAGPISIWKIPQTEAPRIRSRGRIEERKLVAEHVSPPFKEEVKLTLKVSQNLHAATTPYLLGAILGHSSTDAFQKASGWRSDS